jgi:hypothetical protein
VHRPCSFALTWRVSSLAATLIVDETVLNFNVFSNRSQLCDAIRNPSDTANATGCPYGPGQVAVGVQIPVNSSYALASLNTRLRLLDTSNPSRQLACVDISATPYYPRLYAYRLILWIPVGITIMYAALTWLARFWAATTAARADREAVLAASLTAKLGHESLRERLAPVFWEIASGLGLQRSTSLVRFTTPGTRDLFYTAQSVRAILCRGCTVSSSLCRTDGVRL